MLSVPLPPLGHFEQLSCSDLDVVVRLSVWCVLKSHTDLCPILIVLRSPDVHLNTIIVCTNVQTFVNKLRY